MIEAKAWQQGYELGKLKALAAPFKKQKPLVYGAAFGVVNERDIATALKAGEVSWVGSPPQAAAIFKKLNSSSVHQDFAGRAIQVPKGALYIRAIAGTIDGMHKILASLRARHAGEIWLEVFEEMPQAAALAAAHGLNYVASKISASSAIKGLYSSGRAVAPLAAADQPSLACLAQQFLSPFDVDVVRAELAAFAPKWEQHYSTYNKRQSWTAFALAGFDQADPGFIQKPAEMSKQWKAEHPERLAAKCAPTPAMAAFPATMQLLNAGLPGLRYQRLRFMRLRHGDGELTRHADIVDPEAGTAPGKIMRLHIPIETRMGCTFYGWTARGEALTRHFNVGGLWYLDTRKPHAVKNLSNADRVHLVIDAFASDSLRAMAAAGQQKHDVG